MRCNAQDARGRNATKFRGCCLGDSCTDRPDQRQAGRQAQRAASCCPTSHPVRASECKTLPASAASAALSTGQTIKYSNTYPSLTTWGSACRCSGRNQTLRRCFCQSGPFPVRLGRTPSSGMTTPSHTSRQDFFSSFLSFFLSHDWDAYTVTEISNSRRSCY